MIRVVHPGSRIRMLTFYPSRIQGSKRHRIPDPDPQHWFEDLRFLHLWTDIWGNNPWPDPAIENGLDTVRLIDNCELWFGVRDTSITLSKEIQSLVLTTGNVPYINLNPIAFSIVLFRIMTILKEFRKVFRIWIGNFLGLPDQDPLTRGTDPEPSIIKRYQVVRKNLDFYSFWLLYDFLFLKNDANVPSKSTAKSKVTWPLEGYWRKSRIRSRIR